MTRPSCIRNWREILARDTRTYAHATELLAQDANFSPPLGLQRLGVRHQILPPGRRTSLPHAESHEEEFIYVIDGTPDLWLNGELHRLGPGDGVGFPAATGIAHTFLNNSDAAVTLLIVGERDKAENRVIYPVNPEMQVLRTDWWADAPAHTLGPHNGVPDAKI